MTETSAPSGRFSRRRLLQASAGVVAGSVASGAVLPVHPAAASTQKKPGGSVFQVPPPKLDGAPGPTPLAPEVIQALRLPVIPQADPSFIDLFTRCQQMAASVLNTKNDILLMQAEAILSLEAAFRSVTRPGMKALNLVSGVYGNGYTQWLQAFGADVVVLEVPYNQSIDPGAVDTKLTNNPGVELVSVVHVDTPNGTKNPVDQIGPIAKSHGAVTLVDAASTMGGMPLFPDQMGLDIVVGATQKCLAGPVGVGIMSVSQDAWGLIAKNPNAPTNSYLSMTDWKTDWLEGGFFPSGPSITTMYGVEAALSRLLGLGVQQSFDLHQRAARAFWAGATAMGLTPWPVSEDVASDTSTTLKAPSGLTQKQAVAAIRNYGAAVNGSTLTDPLGASGASGQTIRIGQMGMQTSEDFVLSLLKAMGRGFASLGVPIDLPSGLAAARKFF